MSYPMIQFGSSAPIDIDAPAPSAAGPGEYVPVPDNPSERIIAAIDSGELEAWRIDGSGVQWARRVAKHRPIHGAASPDAMEAEVIDDDDDDEHDTPEPYGLDRSYDAVAAAKARGNRS